MRYGPEKMGKKMKVVGVVLGLGGRLEVLWGFAHAIKQHAIIQQRYDVNLIIFSLKHALRLY